MKNFQWLISKPSKILHHEENTIYFELDKGLDYWQKTFYEPTLVKHNGHFFGSKVKKEGDFILTTEFELQHCNQFDQGGIFIHLNESCWMKTGIEVVDNVPFLSCVVTNGFSDWSTQKYETQNSDSDNIVTCKIRVFALFRSNSFVVEFWDGKNWNMMRITHLNFPEQTEEIEMGIYACAPSGNNAKIKFSSFQMEETEGHPHLKL